MTTARCQAKNPALCVDPQCPERRDYRHQMATATNFQDYKAARDRQHADQANQQRAKFASNFPRPAAPAAQTPRPNNTRSAYPAKRRVETNRNGDPIIKFHRDLGFPPGFTPPSGSRVLEYSPHALEEGQKDRYAQIPTFPRVNLDKMELIELKVNTNTKKVERLLYRTELDEDNDICMVLSPMGRSGKYKVVTQWINQANDAHKTLDPTGYVDLRPKAAV